MNLKNLTGKQKAWIVGGVIFLGIGAMNARDDEGGAAMRGRGPMPYGAPMTDNGPIQGGAPDFAAGGYGGGYGGASGGMTMGGNGASADRGDSAVTDGYWARQASQDRIGQAYSLEMRDQSTLQDTGTGEIHTGVSNEVAYPAVDSGAATQVPTAELPTTYDSSASSSAASTSSSE